MSDATSGVRVGDNAPDFMLPAVGGGQASLNEFRGRPVLLTFIRHMG